MLRAGRRPSGASSMVGWNFGYASLALGLILSEILGADSLSPRTRYWNA